MHFALLPARGISKRLGVIYVSRCLASSKLESGTPSGTRLSFHQSEYGDVDDKSTQIVEDLKGITIALVSDSEKSKVHSRQSLFDSSQTLQTDDSKTYSSVKKEVKTGTPNLTRLSVFDSDYGKETMPPDASDKIKGLSGIREKGTSASAVHSRRAMYDSELSMQTDCNKRFDDVVKEVKTGTPNITRLSVFDSDYGKETMPSNASEKIKGVTGTREKSSKSSAIHSRRAMYDSDLSMQTDCNKQYKDVVKEVKTGTPNLTRLSVFDSDYGKETMPSDASEKIKGLTGAREKVIKSSAIHSRQAMYDSEFLQVDCNKQFTDVAKEVKTNTPDLTRFSVFDSDYGNDVMPHDAESKIKGLNGERKVVQNVSKIHNTKNSFAGLDL